MRPRKVILCVDDNEQTLAVRKFLLETRGYRVLTASCALDALALLEASETGAIDLLLCDLIMPHVDGSELVRRARIVRPGVPTLMISGTVSQLERGAEADAFLPKGACSAVELLERVRILVARKRGPRKAVVSAPAWNAGVPMNVGSHQVQRAL
ncbi:response regulator [Terriglobus sp.]|uniref:response regulator n=1 Tax=Terriglobus sp. TaxID=1889013 RepID=UPI003AFFC918